MKYLFFDIESANCFNGTSKICEFGYTITDEKFTVLEKDNILINPKTRFDKRVLREVLSFKEEDYLCHKSFPYFYEDIRNLFMSVDLIIGFSVANDVKAVNDDIKRYNLDHIDYEFYDIQKCYDVLTNRRNQSGLDKVMSELGIEFDGQVHNARDDAYNSMIVLKKIMNELNVSIDELFELDSNIKDRTDDGVVDSIERHRLRREERNSRFMRKKKEEQFSFNLEILLENFHFEEEVA